MRKLFKLPRRGVEIKKRTLSTWRPATFIGREEDEDSRGYAVKTCMSEIVNEIVKERLEFVTHALHWKKPRAEYPRFLIKILHESRGQQQG